MRIKKSPYPWLRKPEQGLNFSLKSKKHFPTRTFRTRGKEQHKMAHRRLEIGHFTFSGMQALTTAKVAGKGVDMNDKIADQCIVPAPKPRWNLRSMQKKRSFIILSANTSTAQHWTYLSWLILTYILEKK
jgi:hypothetical protein